MFWKLKVTTSVKVEVLRMKSSVQFKVVTYANYIISSFIVNTANFANFVERSYEYISLLNVILDKYSFSLLESIVVCRIHGWSLRLQDKTT